MTTTTPTTEELRRIDALVAEKVFGEPKPDYPDETPMWSSAMGMSKNGHWYYFRGGELKGWNCNPYTTSGDAMLQVIEAMRERGWSVRIVDAYESGWLANFWRHEGGDEEVVASTLPLAVCRASLKAQGVEV